MYFVLCFGPETQAGDKALLLGLPEKLCACNVMLKATECVEPGHREGQRQNHGICGAVTLVKL